MSTNPFIEIFNFAMKYNIGSKDLFSKIRYRRSVNKILKSFKLKDKYIISPFIEWYYSGLQFINNIFYNNFRYIKNLIVNDNCISFSIDKNTYNAQISIFVFNNYEPYISLVIDDKSNNDNLQKLNLCIRTDIDDYLINKAGNCYHIVYDLFTLITEEIHDASKYYLLDMKKKGLNW
jgi:hypothetical protein